MNCQQCGASLSAGARQCYLCYAPAGATPTSAVAANPIVDPAPAPDLSFVIAPSQIAPSRPTAQPAQPVPAPSPGGHGKGTLASLGFGGGAFGILMLVLRLILKAHGASYTDSDKPAVPSGPPQSYASTIPEYSRQNSGPQTFQPGIAPQGQGPSNFAAAQMEAQRARMNEQQFLLRQQMGAQRVNMAQYTRDFYARTHGFSPLNSIPGSPRGMPFGPRNMPMFTPGPRGPIVDPNAFGQPGPGQVSIGQPEFSGQPGSSEQPGESSGPGVNTQPSQSPGSDGGTDR